MEAKGIEKMEQNQRLVEEYNDIIVETVATSFHKNSMYHPKSPFLVSGAIVILFETIFAIRHL